jgi:hypothetical protein
LGIPFNHPDKPIPGSLGTLLRLLLDPGFTVHQQFGTGRGWAVYITDRYGEIYSVAVEQRGDPPPRAQQVLASVRHIAAECPE